LVSICQTETSTKSLSIPTPSTEKDKVNMPLDGACTTSTVETNMQHGPGFYEESEVYVPKFNIPMEG